ncbi:MAG TPA: MoaD/ThiS family protein [Verrucomicrobiae bacterium]|nr:MoaD/ThiS family protein [Verrucomicrobiae bacterium]
MTIRVRFWSYFKDFAGGEAMAETLPEGTTVGELHARLMERLPKLREFQKSTLVAVGVDYARPEQVLKDGDEVSFFPPVQGG